MFDLTKYGENPCLVGNGRSYSYKEIHQQVELMKQFLSGRSLILCLCQNTFPALIGYITFIVTGQVPILVEGSQKSEVLSGIISSYSPKFIWTQDNRKDELPKGEEIFRLENFILIRLDRYSNCDQKMDERLQLLLTTSGSTGSIKFVRLSRANLEANAASIIEYLHIGQDDVAVTTLPFSYSFGLSIINTHLVAGASILVTELTPLSREFWELVQQKRVSSLSGVPYTFEMLKRIKFERFDLKSVRYLTQAGGKMTKEGLDYISKLAIEKGWSCYLMYGQTEATARMSYLPPEYLNSKFGSIGQPVSGGNFSIIDEDGNLIQTSFKQGELVYTGANVGMGYATCKDDLICGDDWNGRLLTGDLGYRDEEGFYFITGRLKRFIKLFGNRVSLDEVELQLNLAFAESEFICSGEDNCLNIYCTGGVSREEVITRISSHLSIHRSVIKYSEILQIPRLSNGKVNYKVLT